MVVQRPTNVRRGKVVAKRRGNELHLPLLHIISIAQSCPVCYPANNGQKEE
jgi:hypothetical protein